VEDDYLISAEMDAELTSAGFEVVGIATSANEAIRMAMKEKPDVIIMDIQLGIGIDGIEAAKTIFNSSGIRCIFASAYHNPETRRLAEPFSPLGWLAKPYTMTSLIDAVRTALHDLGRFDD
jgi:DNA-binding NarL/FixJ family response regulator